MLMIEWRVKTQMNRLEVENDLKKHLGRFFS